MIAVSLNLGGGGLIEIGKTVHEHANNYKHNEDGRTAPGVCSNGSVPLSHSGNVVTRFGIHTQTSKPTTSLDRLVRVFFNVFTVINGY